jgi:hypothetical protein
VSLVQRFRPAGAPGGFALLGHPVVAVDGAIRSDDEARRFADMAEEAARRFEGDWDRWRAAGTA